MATGIEAEMARFEEEVLGNEQRSRRLGPGIPDLPPPPFMHRPFDMMHGPGDMMMGPGPMHGLGPMMMGPGGMVPDHMMTKPKVYSAAPQITKAPQVVKRKAGDIEIGVSSSKILATEAPSSSSSLHDSTFGTSFANTYLIPKTLKVPAVSTSSHTPSAFSQATAASGYDTAKLMRKKKFVRTAAGQTWEDASLLDWDQNDYRIFCGDLGNEVTDDILARVFNKYTSFLRARVVRDTHSKKSKGYGFVSFKDPNDFIRAMREMNGKYVGNRPIKLRKSTWKDRNVDIVKKKIKEKKKLGYKI